MRARIRSASDAKPKPQADFGAPGIDLEVPWLSGGTVVLTGNSFCRAPCERADGAAAEQAPVLAPYKLKAVQRAAASNAERKGRACDGS